jgi:hypothetical protein
VIEASNIPCGSGHTHRKLPALSSPPLVPCISCDSEHSPPPPPPSDARPRCSGWSSGDLAESSHLCNGYELLAHILSDHSIGLDRNESRASGDERCVLQREILTVASQLSVSLGAAVAQASSSSPPPFTLLQDCEPPWCCPAELAGFAYAHPHASVFAVSAPSPVSEGRGPPANLWELEPAADVEMLTERRDAARSCGGGCLTIQIAHALQGHGLLTLMAEAGQAAIPAAAPLVGGAPYLKRQLQWGGGRDDTLASSQEAAAGQTHSALLRAAKQATGGVHVAAAPGKVVGGPSASSRLDPLPLLPAVGASTAAASHASLATLTGTDVHPKALGQRSPSPPPPVDTGTGTGWWSHDTGNVEASRHFVALGGILRAARRTLLLLPAAEAMTTSLNAAEAKGLPQMSRLRALLPYRTAREAERWLSDAAAAADAASGHARTAMSMAAPELKFLRIGGAAQKWAHARGHILILVVNDRRDASNGHTLSCADPHDRTCLEAAAAAAAGSLLVSSAIALRLTRSSACRLRALLARGPLSIEMRPSVRWWRLAADAIISTATTPIHGAQTALTSVSSIDASSGGLDNLLGVARDVIDALIGAREELQRRGLCGNKQAPLVLSGPGGGARLVSACAVDGGTTQQPAADDLCAARGAPLVRCADDVCRPTFVHCFRALYPPSREREDILASALPSCASDERRRQLEDALPRAAELLTALASYHAADRALFPRMCAVSAP